MENKPYINWLEKQSLLYNAKQLARQISGTKLQWQHPYALPQSDAAIKVASVWFSAYPAATITSSGQNILQFLSDKKLWEIFTDIGINALHTGPMKQAGGIINKEYTPTVDGWFDRISLNIDPEFGTEADYRQLAHKTNIIGDIVPGHTGKGADFLLALRNYKDYPGIYTLIEIEPQDWHLLPKVNAWESINLSVTTVNKLYKKGYIPGNLQRVLFLNPKAKTQVTGWDATGAIKGVDGKTRRWVYLHYFKSGQPTMNWLDPSYAAAKIIAGDIIKSIKTFNNKILRVDANPFLGIEIKPNSTTAWSEGHPLSVTASNNIAALSRKLGGYTFQELNLTLDAIKTFSEFGPDLSYDFITRPALQHAILTKNTKFLRFMLELMQQYEINPQSLIHGMQNHDEITYELVHFLEHSEDKFNYDNKTVTGKQLRDQIINEMHKLAIGPKTPYNQLSGNGLCTTFTGLVATRLGITDIYHLTAKQKQQIKQGHLLMVLFNAMQPGVFSISGWDLVGALPLPLASINHLLKDKDYRWLNRGAIDLLNSNCKLKNIPTAQTLYGPIKQQLNDPNSFASQLKHILDMRKKYKLDQAEQIAIPKVHNQSALIMLHKLSQNLGYEITALNFGDKTITEDIIIENNTIKIELSPLQGKIIHTAPAQL